MWSIWHWPRRCPGSGRLSLLNRVLVLAIFLATFVAVIETEPTIAAGRVSVFRDVELGFGLLFGLEYLARLWVSVEQPMHHGVRRSRWRYARSPDAVIDLIAFLPALVALSGAVHLGFASSACFESCGWPNSVACHVPGAIWSKQSILGGTNCG